MSQDTVVIKKYGNRRLYDTAASRYVNLEDVAQRIREGAAVQVIDAGSGEDLTRVTLTQIIVEDARGESAGLPLELLRQLIVASDKARQDFLMWYLNRAFDAYQKVQDAIHDQWSGVRSVATAPFEGMRPLFTPPGGTQPDRAQIDELRQRIVELESKLKSEKKKSSRPRVRTAKS
jgi:polyhydroxyalkanoate synthesis repressor PhaR